MASPEVLATISRMKQRDAFPSFIDYIRFPKFRNLEANSRIDFTCPFTVFVGQNGCGKSSALQALFGAPAGQSTGTYWFETPIDPITQTGEDRHCFIYSFGNAGAAGEVLKTRILTPDKPERWDTSESLEKYGMLSPGTRLARPVEKPVVYINFRTAQNAFEKAFHEERPPASGVQEMLRWRSTALSRVLSGRKPGKGYGGYKTFEAPVSLTDEELRAVSQILGRTYVRAVLIKHRFFKLWGYSVKLFSEYGEYSEAFAGSGESAVVLLVHEVMGTPEGSLLLLDEPETSLHPGAQAMVQEFLLCQCRDKRHQVIVCSHAPELVRGLPPEAVKVFTPTPELKFRVLPNVQPSEAFFFLGLKVANKCVIFVEDKLAKMMVTEVMNSLPEQVQGLFEVRFYPGGHTVMKVDAYQAARNGHNYWYLFDGDALPASPFGGRTALSLLSGEEVAQPDLGYRRLTTILEGWLGNVPTFPVEGTPEEQSRRRLEEIVRYAEFADKRFGCFPSPGADVAIWDVNAARQIAATILGEGAAEELLTSLGVVDSAKGKFRDFSEAIVKGSRAAAIEVVHRIFVTRWSLNESADRVAIVNFIEKCRQSFSQHSRDSSG